MIYAELFAGFLKVGFFSFGGAYSAIPLIRDVVLSYGWLTDEALGTMIAISESTPGPIMVNLATYVGSSQAGLSGAALATLAVVLPSFFVILLAMNLLGNLLRHRAVQAVLQGIKPCMTGIILATGVYMTLRSCLPLSQTGSLDCRALLITALLLIGLHGYRHIRKKKLSPIALIVASALLGMLFA